MAGKENSGCVRLTRATAKRAAAAAPFSDVHQPPLNKRKRVPLGELPTLANAPVRSLTAQTKPPTKLVQPPSAAAQVEPQQDAAVDGMDAGSHDPQMCADYAPDIYQYLRSKEVKKKPLENYMEKTQKEVTSTMRGILVDWLVEVAEEYKLVPDTLYLTISYIDRFLSSKSVAKNQLQLLGVSAMLIASKYEEINAPHVEDFCFITDNTYTNQEVVKMESDILNFLKFELGGPTVKTFLRRFINAGQEDYKDSQKLEFLCCYLAELSLLEYDCHRFLPSLIAASAVYLARFTMNPNSHPWSATLQHCTGYKPFELKDCVHVIHDLQLNKKWMNLVACKEKYKQHKFKSAAKLLSQSEIPESYFGGIED